MRDLEFMSDRIDPVPEHRHLDHDAITAQLRFLMGKVLTVVDAAFSDNEQRKAVKDLVRGAFREQHVHIRNIQFDTDGKCGSVNPAQQLVR